MKRIHCCILMLVAASLFALTGCESGKPSEEGHARAIRLINEAHESKNYQVLLQRADSLLKTGDLSEPEAYYWQGYACERSQQLRMAEFYWKTAITQTGNSKEPEDLAIYAKSSSRLASLLGIRGEYDTMLEVAEAATKRLEEQGCDTMSDYTNLLIYVSSCKSRLNMPEDEVTENYNRAYQQHMKNIEENRSDVAYKNAIAGLVTIIYNCNDTQHYRQSIIWLDHYAELIRQYELRNDADPSYVDRQWARYDTYRAIALNGLGKKEEANQIYQHYLTTNYSKTPDGRIAVNDYLSAAGLWAEVANNYESLDALLKTKDYTIEDMQKTVLKKYHANRLAGRRDSAIAVSLDISEALDSAITWTHRQDAEEMSTISRKAQDLANKAAANTQKNTMMLLAAIACIFLGFSAYTVYRRLKSIRLAKKYKTLKTTLANVKEAKTSDDRRMLEQDIARQFQSALTPTTLPQHQDLRLFATLRPASETDGELYDCLIRDDKLFFCIGDAKGEGVATPLAMSIAREEFRRLSDDKTEPAEMMAAINKTLIDRQVSDMTMTLLIGILDLTTGRLRYTNAGHTAPMLVGSGIGLLPIDPTPAAGTQGNAVFQTQVSRIDPGTIIFLFADSLTETTNANGDKYNERFVQGEGLQAMKVLKEKLTPEAFVKWMQEAIGRFVPESTAYDSPTMLALQYKEQVPGMPYQRSISLTNHPKDEAYVAYFATEVCAALHLDRKTSSLVEEELKGMVASLLQQTYPEGTPGNVHIEAHSEGTTLDFEVSAESNKLTLTKNITKQ